MRIPLYHKKEDIHSRRVCRMDEKQKFIEAWEEILTFLNPDYPKDKLEKKVEKVADEKFGLNSLPQTDTHA